MVPEPPSSGHEGVCRCSVPPSSDQIDVAAFPGLNRRSAVGRGCSFSVQPQHPLLSLPASTVRLPMGHCIFMLGPAFISDHQRRMEMEVQLRVMWLNTLSSNRRLDWLQSMFSFCSPCVHSVVCAMFCSVLYSISIVFSIPDFIQFSIPLYFTYYVSFHFLICVLFCVLF